MPLIQWSEKYSVNDINIDNQHKEIIRIINLLYDTQVAGTREEYMENILNSLLDYTKYHFKYEEDLMTKRGYVEIDTHKKEHQNLLDSTLNFKRLLKNKNNIKFIDLMSFLERWLIYHITESDKEFSDFLKNKE
jgi:hemerythrin-like metal-binding protein